MRAAQEREDGAIGGWYDGGMDDVLAAVGLAHVALGNLPGQAAVLRDHQAFIDVHVAVAGQDQRAVFCLKRGAGLAQAVGRVARQHDFRVRPGDAVVVGPADDVRRIVPALERLGAEMVDALAVAE